MSSTNKTANYDLSQFIANDKPAWLQDYNTDMSKIDAGIKGAADTATSADGKASANTTNIGDMSYLSTTAKNNLVAAINEVDTKSETAQSTANAATQTATNANTNATNAINQIANFNLTNVSSITGSTTAGTLTNFNFTCATNSDGSLAKVYGQVFITNATQPGTLTLKTSLRPESRLTIQGCALTSRFLNNGGTECYPASYTIETNGDVKVEFYASSAINTSVYVMLLASILFIKDFGNTPVTP